MNLKETGREDAQWIRLAEVREDWRVVVKTVMNLRVP
jgi:hypothetical protein